MQESPSALRGLRLVSHGRRLFAEPESSQVQRFFALFLGLSSCLGCVLDTSSFVSGEKVSRDIVACSESQSPMFRSEEVCSVVARSRVRNSRLSQMEQKSPSFASTRDDTQLDAGIRKLQQPAWHGSVCRQMTSFWRPTHERKCRSTSMIASSFIALWRF